MRIEGASSGDSLLMMRLAWAVCVLLILSLFVAFSSSVGGSQQGGASALKNTIRLSAFLFTATVLPVAAQNDIPTGARLYQENCASCHGANLEGQPEWRSRLPNGRLPAPPHDPSGHTWHHSDRILTDIVKRGTAAIVGNGYESDMPGFEEVLKDEEIVEILAFIKNTWPDRIRELQESRSQADEKVQP